MTWTPYILQRLSAAGVPLKRAWDATDAHLIEEPPTEEPYAIIWYNAETESRELELGLGIRFRPTLQKLDDILISGDISCLIEEMLDRKKELGRIAVIALDASSPPALRIHSPAFYA